MKPGRNDPCPCGSGKKYKHCCLQVQETSQTEDFLWHQIHHVIKGLPEKLLKFSVKHFEPEALLEAWGDFTLWSEEEFDLHTPHMRLFMPWFFYNWHPEFSGIDENTQDERTTAQAFLDKYGKQLEPLLKRYIEQCCVTPFSFYDIVTVRPGDGFVLRDILTDAECYVTEHSGSMHAQAGQIVFGKLVKVDHVAILEASAPIFFPPIEKFAILELREEIYEIEDPPSQELLRDFDFEYEMLEIYHEIYDRLCNPSIPELCNTDDDPMVFQKLIYDIPSPQTALAALKQLCINSTEDELLEDAGFDADGELYSIEFPWLKRGNSKQESWDNTVLGHIKIKGHQLTVEVNSEERARKFQQLIKEIHPEARYRTSVIESPQAMLARAKDEDEDESFQARQRREELEELNNRPEVQEKIMEFMREHYRKWPQEKLSILGGKTPLQAIKTRDGREMVEALVRDFELTSLDSNPPIDPSIFAELRERLGLKLTD